MESKTPPPRLSISNLLKLVQPGDVLAYSGTGAFSATIKLVTRCIVSHVSVYYGEGQIAEALSQGIAFSEAKEDLADYEGKVWFLPLSAKVREKFNPDIFQAYCREMLGRKYDMEQAIFSALDIGGSKFDSFHNRESHSSLFCSEFAAGALENAGAIKRVNTSEVTPRDLVRLQIYSGKYWQIRGKGKRIEGYNSIPPRKFRV